MSETPEYRWNELMGAWVLVAPGRVAVMRPDDPLAGLPPLRGPCPFCPGNEAMSEPALLVRGATGDGPWGVRVLTNKYPIVPARVLGAREAAAQTHATGVLPGFGRHELVIESPIHDSDLATYPDAHRFEVLAALRDRAAALAAMDGVEWLSLFRNKGLKSGSSQPHPHTQLVATSLAMPDPAHRWQRALAHHAAHGETLLDRVLSDELADRDSDGNPRRIVLATDAWVVLAPFAPTRTFETWVVPRRARGCFTRLSDAELASLSVVLGQAIRAVLGAAIRTDYNVLFRLPPVANRHHAAAFFTIEIIPRGTTVAGFELVSGSGVAARAPESCAEELRRAVASP